MIRCDIIRPDGPPDQARRLILRDSTLASVFRIAGPRTPPTLSNWDGWIRDAVPGFGSEIQVNWLQHPALEKQTAEGQDSLALLSDAKHKQFASAGSGSAWLTVLSAANDPEAKARQARHEAAIERLYNHPWLAIERLSVTDYLKLMTGFTGVRKSHAGGWDTKINPGFWFQPGRSGTCINLGRYWWASVYVSRGPANHRPWADFVPPHVPCMLSVRISGDAQSRFRFRSWVTGLVEKAGNQSQAHASTLLYDLPSDEAVAVGMAGLAGGQTPDEANAAAAELAAQLEAWLGVRVSLKAEPLSVLAHCVPAFIGTKAGLGPGQLSIWPATTAQSGCILPIGQPASPWQPKSPVQPFIKTKASFHTAASQETPRGYPVSLFGTTPTFVILIAGQAGSGKSMGLSELALEFTQQNPQAPIRILDVGESAAPLAHLWRQNGHAVATPDLTGIPPVNPLQPPFPLTAGGPLQLSGVMMLLSLVVPEFTGRRPALAERAVKLTWGLAGSGRIAGKDPKAVEASLQKGDIEAARLAHARVAPNLHDLALTFASPAMAGPRRDDEDAAYLNKSLTEVTHRLPELIQETPAEWVAANRMIAELGGQAMTDDPLTPVRYALGLLLLTGDLVPTDWDLGSAPGPAAAAYAADLAKRLRAEPKLLMGDEVHRLKGFALAEKWLERGAREGRKALLGMALASQQASDFPEAVIAQSSIQILFGNDPTGVTHFGLDSAVIRPGTGNAALRAVQTNGMVYQAALRLHLSSEQLWALGSGARERALVADLTRERRSHAEALKELARRLPSGRLPPDAPPARELVQTWTQ